MRRNLFRSLFVMAAAIAGFVFVHPPIYAQGAVNSTGNGGRHTVKGTVFLPNGRRPETPIKVQLQSTTQTPLSIYADRNGNFSFRSLSTGSYSIVVDLGKNFEITREYITIDPDLIATRSSVTSKIVTVPVYLRFKQKKRLNNQLIDAKLAAVPKAAMEHYKKALAFIRKDKIKESVKELRAAVSLHTNFSIALTELGKQYLRLDKLNEALNSLRRSMKIDPENVDTKLNLGIALLNNREIDAAEKLLKEVAAAELDAVTPHYYLGIVFMQKTNLDGAQKELEFAKKLKGDKDLPLVHKYLGGIYWAKKEYKLAANELETYLSIFPNAKDARKLRETIATLRKKY